MRALTNFIILIFLGGLPVLGQLGGDHTYAFLDLPNSARVAALGGKQISLKDNDLNISYYNPSVLNSGIDQSLALNYVGYYADIKWGYASYAWQNKYLGSVAVGIHYLNYNSFIGADELGIKTGNFYASDYAFNLSWAKQLDSVFSIGVNVKPIYSNYERYNSLGIVTDFGVTYNKPENLFTASLVVRSLGTQITTYTPNNREKLPFEILLGVTQKLKYAPFRFSLVAQHLEQFDYTYKVQNSETSTFGNEDDEPTKLADFAEKSMRHLIAGVEFLPTKSFTFRLGYNYQRRQELKIEEKPGMVGFSWGFGLKLTRFELNYGRAIYHLAGGTNYLSVTSNLNKFYKRGN